MQLPGLQPSALRGGTFNVASRRLSGAVTPQGCNWFACAGAVAKCISSGNPIECILSEAPKCLDCIG